MPPGLPPACGRAPARPASPALSPAGGYRLRQAANELFINEPLIFFEPPQIKSYSFLCAPLWWLRLHEVQPVENPGGAHNSTPPGGSIPAPAARPARSLSGKDGSYVIGQNECKKSRSISSLLVSLTRTASTPASFPWCCMPLSSVSNLAFFTLASAMK